MSEPTHPARDLPLDKIEMLNEPLMTEEGFINEACLNELEAAIKNMPESHKRLANNPEWSRPCLTTEPRMLAALAQSAVRAYCQPPPGLETVLHYLKACLRRTTFTDDVDYGGLRMVNLSLCEINRLLWDALGGLKQFEDWNTEEVMGKEWLDLSALLHQTCITIRNERRHEHAFDLDFIRHYGKAGGA